MTIKSACCDATENVHDAVNNGEWVPYFWDENLDAEVVPTCGNCVKLFGIGLDNYGEYYRPLEAQQ